MEIVLVRHGETEWSRSGRHTSRTDLPLTLEGENRARAAARLLTSRHFSLLLSSPMRRAIDTSRLAGFSAEVSEDLREWDYGAYEGLTTEEIQRQAPGWTIWTGVVPQGESVEDVGHRAARVIDRALHAGGDAVLFGHGHMLRVLAACWLGSSPDSGRLYALSTGSVSILGFEHETRVIRVWNQTA